ncbi:MAG: urea amidolyase family protein [Synoicihabitans sp.]
MTIRVLSDTALLIQVPGDPSEATLRQVRALGTRIVDSRWKGVKSIVPAANSIAIYIRRPAQWLRVAALIEELLGEVIESEEPTDSTEERVIPVCYREEFAPDMKRVSRALNLPVDEIIERHCAPTYTVMAVGFAPGFPYLSGLDPQLHCPRLPSPRVRVPVGAVGIGGSQTGVYPLELPGGWNLIGRTSLKLFDPTAEHPALLKVGDKVRFESVEELVIDSPRTRPPLSIESTPPDEIAGIEVIDPGAQTTVQDLGRPSGAITGVTEGGAMNRRALRIANLLVGNDEELAAMEWVMRGPRLRFHQRCLVAITGTLAREVPFARPFVVEAGEELDLTKLTEPSRGILAVSGGIDVPVVLDSRSTHLSGRFGGWDGRALRRGDLLPVGANGATDVSPGWRILPTWVGGSVEAIAPIRVLTGPESGAFSSEAWAKFLNTIWTIKPDSNRMGIRLTGDKIEPTAPIEMVSQPVDVGTIQIPASGEPIVLMADRQTLGGYPRLASVIAVDLAILAQVPLGQRIRFVETDLKTAEALRHEEDRQLALMRAAIKPRLSRTS